MKEAYGKRDEFCWGKEAGKRRVDIDIAESHEEKKTWTWRKLEYEKKEEGLGYVCVEEEKERESIVIIPRNVEMEASWSRRNQTQSTE